MGFIESVKAPGYGQEELGWLAARAVVYTTLAWRLQSSLGSLLEHSSGGSLMAGGITATVILGTETVLRKLVAQDRAKLSQKLQENAEKPDTSVELEQLCEELRTVKQAKDQLEQEAQRQKLNEGTSKGKLDRLQRQISDLQQKLKKAQEAEKLRQEGQRQKLKAVAKSSRELPRTPKRTGSNSPDSEGGVVEEVEGDLKEQKRSTEKVRGSPKKKVSTSDARRQLKLVSPSKTNLKRWGTRDPSSTTDE